MRTGESWKQLACTADGRTGEPMEISIGLKGWAGCRGDWG